MNRFDVGFKIRYAFTIREMVRKGMDPRTTIQSQSSLEFHNLVRKDLGLKPAFPYDGMDKTMSECEAELRQKFYKNLRG